MSAEKQRVPLEDIMVAMDVVDTLRHHEIMVDRELGAQERKEQLIAKLREIYASQGIEVTDAMLEEGVRALEEDRFVFTPASNTFSTWLAKIYVKRDRWLKPMVTLLGVSLIASLFYYMTFVRPLQLAKANLPIEIENRYQEVVNTSSDTKAIKAAAFLRDEANSALQKQDIELAKKKLKSLYALLENLQQSYTVQIVQGARKHSGIWRIPPGENRGKNYYLIVEARNVEGEKIEVQIRNEENDEVAYVKEWGVRVDKQTFERVARDKADDGIIQDRIVGVKKAGRLSISYHIPTTGASITKW